MPIASNELIFRRAALLSDIVPAQNGGRMTSAPITSAVKNNLFPDVTQAQRTAGASHARKLFLHVASAAEVALMDARLFLEDITPGDDYVLLYAGTQTDTEEAVIGRPYGVGRLVSAVAADATVLLVDFEHAEFATWRPVRAGDVLRVANIPATGGTGAEVLATVDRVTWAGARATVTLTAALGAVFDPAGIPVTPVTVSSVIGQALVQASATVPGDTSAAGTYTGTPGGSNRGTVAQAWTLVFTSPTAYRLDGDTLGAAVATGSVSADFAPVNPGGGVYFSLPASGWGGTWSAGNTLTFSTAPATVPLWLRRVVPAGAGSVAGDGVVVGVQGESA